MKETVLVDIFNMVICLNFLQIFNFFVILNQESKSLKAGVRRRHYLFATKLRLGITGEQYRWIYSFPWILYMNWKGFKIFKNFIYSVLKLVVRKLLTLAWRSSFLIRFPYGDPNSVFSGGHEHLCTCGRQGYCPKALDSQFFALIQFWL